MKNWPELDKKYIWHPFTQMEEWLHSDPLVIERAEGNFLIDTDGRKYLDGVSSLWVNVHGITRKRWTSQSSRNWAKWLIQPSSSWQPSIHRAGKKLVKITPEGLNRVFYSDSGSTAVEVALKIAFQYWRNLGFEKKTVCHSVPGISRRHHRLCEPRRHRPVSHHFSSAAFPDLDDSHSFPVPQPGLNSGRMSQQVSTSFSAMAADRADEIAARCGGACGPRSSGHYRPSSRLAQRA